MATTARKIKLPVDLIKYSLDQRQLVNKYETNRFLKSVCFYLLLKSETPYSVIKNYTKQLHHLKTVTGTSTGTFYNRLRYLENEGLLTITGDCIRLASFKDFAQRYLLDLTKVKTIDYDKIDPKNLHLVFMSIEIEQNKSDQRFMIEKKLRKNPELKQRIINRLLHMGADPLKLTNFDYLLNAMRKAYTLSFIWEPETHDLFKEVRPDCNRGIKGMADAWNFKNKQSVSYYKKQMRLQGLITVIPGEKILSKTRARNKDCDVKWIKKRQQTFLRLVDTIQILSL